MIELVTLVFCIVVLIGLSIPFVFWMAKETVGLFDRAGSVTLNLIDRARSITYQAGMDVISLWAAGHNSALDVAERRAELDHTKEESELALTAKQHRLELGKAYAQFRLKQQRRQMLESEVIK